MADFDKNPFAKKYKSTNEARHRALEMAKHGGGPGKLIKNIPKSERRDYKK